MIEEKANSEIIVADRISGGKILIVDDELLIRKTMSLFLGKNNFAVDTAENGEVAIAMLEKKEYDLVITDLKMPGMDGRAVLKAMAERFSNIPRIVLTAVGSNEDILLALKTGAYDFIAKPIVDYALLIYTIQRALERKKLNDERNQAIAKLEKVNDVLSLINRGFDTEEIFKMLDVTLKTVIPFNRITLIHLDQNQTEMEIRIASSDRRMLLKRKDIIHYDAGTFGSFINDADGVFIIKDLPDFLRVNNFPPEFNLIAEEGFHSVIFLSMTVNDERWGYLMLASEDINLYNEEHARFLQLISGQIALGIQRGELIAELEKHSEHLEKMVKTRTHDVLKTQKTAIFALSRLAETRDNETGDHLFRIRNYCLLLAQLYKYSAASSLIDNSFLRDIYDSSILHDIGKVGISDQILLKPGPLTPEEFEIMKSHTTIGYKALIDPKNELGDDPYLDMAKDIILYHHERWDGKGYPYGLAEDKIPLAARIVSICDVYDALTSKRPYKEALSHERTMEIMKNEKFKYDPVLFEIFCENNAEFDKIRYQYL